MAITKRCPKCGTPIRVTSYETSGKKYYLAHKSICRKRTYKWMRENKEKHNAAVRRAYKRRKLLSSRKEAAGIF